CGSCRGIHAWCRPCTVKVQKNLPFHKLQSWNGTHYQAISLMDLGFIWHISHCGDPCPNSKTEEWDFDQSISQYQMTVVHTNGIFTHQVSWCCCPGADSKGWHFELLKERLFPASITKPKIAFSFQVLDHFLIDALECKTSAMSFYQKLKRITSNAFPEQLPVSCYFILDHLFE
ncbi:hypothetical protein SCLCIDRAFT_125631, partial [Scleroderma citrinum Foug A]